MEIGLQTFTVRRAQKKNIRSAFLPLIKLGIRTYELARMDFNDKNAKEIRKLIDEYGIEISSIQVKPKYVFGDPYKIIRFAKAVNTHNVVISMLPFSVILGKEKRFYDFILGLDTYCELYQKEGITLAYHHHNWEYVTLKNGKTRMDELLCKTEKIKFVSDTYWTAKSGIDPSFQLEKFSSRLLGVHLRDLAVYKKGLKAPTRDCTVGTGVLNFEKILFSIENTACEYAVIEQKTKKPYEDIKSGYKYLSNLKMKTENI